ncbi:MAG: T9SS type A sorting domain-containing protein, partial [Saprospiraceae bacterium]|nr:T9SS type A sorting domain-containing protein [Saprospiraceae bacterium]
LDASGNFVWAKQMTGINGEVGYAVASDSNGNVYATGYFEGTVDFNPGAAIDNQTSNGNQDVFIVKLCQITTPTITADGPTTFCQGSSVKLTASPASSYLWSNGATTPSITVSTPGNYTVMVTNAGGCSAASSATTVTVNPVLPASVAIIGPMTICLGQNATFTPTPNNGGTAPAYQWFVNDSLVGTGPMYSTTALTNGAQVYCTMTSNAVCANPVISTSNSLTITVYPALVPGVSVTVSPAPICSGDNVTFSATPTNGGTLPSYQWYVNGEEKGGNSPIYSTMALSGMPKIYCRMTSNAACANPKAVTSDTLIIIVNSLLPTHVNIGSLPECSFVVDSTTNGGTAPSFKWYVNDTLIGESNSPIYTNTTLVNGGKLYCIMTSNADCAYPDTVKSNTLIVANCITVISTKDKERLGHITVFPNPAGDFFTIEGNELNSGLYRINLNNMSGQTLIEKSIWLSGQDFTIQLNVEGFPSGNYYIIIYSELDTYTIQVQKLE